MAFEPMSVLNTVYRYLYLDKYTSRWIDRAIIFRVWLGAFACMFCLLITPVERSSGQAAFLPIVLYFIRFPSDPTIVYLFHSLIGGLGVMLTWAWCVLCMKLGDVVRDHGEDQLRTKALQQTIHQNNPDYPSSQIEAKLLAEVFKGAFLQTRVSILYAAFLLVGTYFSFLIRGKNTRLFFIMVFQFILLALVTTIGPLVPMFYALELTQVFLIPYAYYLAITMFVAIFVFPQTVSHAVLEILRSQACILGEMTKLTPKALKALHNDEVDPTVADWDKKRISFYQLQDKLGFLLVYLCKELSFAKASGRDVRKLADKLRTLSADMAGQSIFIHHARQGALTHMGKVVTSDRDDASGDSPLFNHPVSVPFASSAALGKLLSELSVDTERHQVAIDNALKEVIGFLDRQTNWNHCLFGLMYQPSRDTKSMEVVLDELRSATTDRLQIKHPLSPKLSIKPTRTNSLQVPDSEKTTYDGVDTALITGAIPTDDDDDEKAISYLREAWDAFLNALTIDLIEILDLAVKIEKRPVQTWWPGAQNRDDYPNAIREPKVTQFLRVFGIGNGPTPLDDDDPDSIGGLEHPIAPALSPGHLDNQEASKPKFDLGVSLYNFYNWFTTSPESIFALKVSVLALVLACPAWITDNGTAAFYYREKGIWALVGGCTAKGMFSAETTYGFIQRAIGVVVGGVVALVTWYISVGSGHGNPYGLAAVYGVVLLFTIPWRIWHTNFLFIITVTTTATLVVGYSWIGRPDTSVYTYFGPGQGWEVFYKRELTVLIGLAAAWIIDLLPRPQPGRESIRRTYARATMELGNSTAILVSSLRTVQRNSPEAAVLFSSVQQTLAAIHSKLRITAVRLQLAKLEPSLRRQFQPERYAILQRLQYDAIDLLGVLSVCFQTMDESVKTNVLSTHVFENEQVASLLNYFNTASSALATERPVPSMLPSANMNGVKYDSLDDELNNIVAGLPAQFDDRRTQLFVIAEGTFIHLGRIAERLVEETAALYGVSMRFAS